MSARHAKDFRTQFGLSYECEPQPHSLPFNPSCITHFTFSTKNDGKYEYFEAALKKGKQEEILKFDKHRRRH